MRSDDNDDEDDDHDGSDDDGDDDGDDDVSLAPFSRYLKQCCCAERGHKSPLSNSDSASRCICNRGDSLLPNIRVLASITRVAIYITRHGYEEHLTSPSIWAKGTRVPDIPPWKPRGWKLIIH